MKQITDNMLHLALNDKPMFVVYEFYNKNNECLYVGKSRDFYSRIWQHYFKNCKIKEDISYVVLHYLNNISDQALAEVYFILKNQPKYNEQYLYDQELSFNIAELNNIETEKIYISVLFYEWQHFTDRYCRDNQIKLKHKRNFFTDENVNSWSLQLIEDMDTEETKSELLNNYEDYIEFTKRDDYEE